MKQNSIYSQPQRCYTKSSSLLVTYFLVVHLMSLFPILLCLFEIPHMSLKVIQRHKPDVPDWSWTGIEESRNFHVRMPDFY